MSSWHQSGPNALCKNRTVLHALYHHHHQNHKHINCRTLNRGMTPWHWKCQIVWRTLYIILCTRVFFWEWNHFHPPICWKKKKPWSKQYLVVRNSISLLVFSSDSVEDSSSSSRSAVICGRFPMLPPRLTLDDVEDELSPESATGDACHSRRKSNPPAEMREWAVCYANTIYITQ